MKHTVIGCFTCQSDRLFLSKWVVLDSDKAETRALLHVYARNVNEQLPNFLIRISESYIIMCYY